MNGPYEAIQVSEHVYWVGAIDWGIRNFHGYATSRGTTYNAYLIVADKVTLVDTVKRPFKDELVARVSSVVSPTKVDYILSNHSEMDHSGLLPEMIELMKPEKVFASKNGVKALAAQLHHPHTVEVVPDGGTISLGNMTLTALLTPMIHWPDSMITYLDADKLLFSQDGFGLHLASHERWADEMPEDIVWHEMTKYYANILTPLSGQIARLLTKVGELNLPIEVLANDHGPLFRKDIGTVLARYQEWTEQKPTKKAVVTYDTMWNSTEKMARAIAEGLASRGIHANVMPLDVCHRSDVATAVLESGALVVGSPTLNNGLFPTVADLLCYLKGLKPKNLVGAAFGSFGWSGQAPGMVHDALAEMKVDLVSEPLKLTYVPDAEALGQCRALGQSVAERLIEKCEA